MKFLTAGIDEAGRGPWAGPVYAAIVILNPEQEEYLRSIGVHDSKKVSEKKRKILFEEILKNSTYAKVKFYDVEEIDRLGIYIATQEVIKQLVNELTSSRVDGLIDFVKLRYNVQGENEEASFDSSNHFETVKTTKNQILKQVQDDNVTLQIKIDGLFPKLELISSSGKKLNFETIIDGDEKEVAISAASILAKVKRDEFMRKLHEKYPEYSFDKHKGYGTKLHLENLKKHGPSPVHRKSFKPVKDLLVNKI